MERLLEIAHEPAVWKFLRVCWKNNSQELNCGRCEKCVRTMVSLAAAGVLPKCETFPGRDELPARIESLTNLHPNEYLFWDQIAEANLPTELLRSVDVLRQRKPAHPPQRRPRQFA